jgi:type I restriction enzyme S subunit
MTKLRALQPYLNQLLPDEWKLIPLGQIIDLAYGEGLSDENRVAGNIPVFGSNGIVGYHNNAIVKGPAIIVGRKGSAGEVTWSDVDCFPIDTTFFVRPLIEDLDFRWLYYQLVHVNFTRLNAATGVPGLSRSDALDICIPFFDKTEQSRISKVIQQVDYAIENIEFFIEKAQQLKKALMQNLLSGRLKPDGTWRSSNEFACDEKNGKVPMKWRVFRLDELAKVTMGQSPGGDTLNVNGVGIPFIQGKADLGDLSPLPSQYTSDPKKVSEPGDILFTVRAPVGYVCKNNLKLAIGRGIAALKEYQRTDYIFYALQRYKQKFLSLEQGTTFTEINQRELKKFKILAPEDEHERASIITRICDIDDFINKSTQTLQEILKLKKSLMQNLLTGKIRIQAK